MSDPAFLLDSNICIYILRDAGSAPALRVQAQPWGRVVTSAIVAAEVLRGIDDDAQIEAARRFFEIVSVLPFDAEAAMRYGMVPFRRGRYDRLIAAHALALDLILITNNEADFADIAGLRVENWTRPRA